MRLKDKRVIEGLFLLGIVIAFSISLFLSEENMDKITGNVPREAKWAELKDCLKTKTTYECLYKNKGYFVKPNKKHWVKRLKRLDKLCSRNNKRIICRALDNQAENKIYVINESYNPPEGSVHLEAEELSYWLLNETKCYNGVCNVKVNIKPKIPGFCLDGEKISLKGDLIGRIDVEDNKEQCYEGEKTYDVQFNIPKGSSGKYDIIIEYRGANYIIDPYFEDMSNSSCYVTQNCNPGDNAIMSLSKNGNAHGALNESYYNWKLCCNGTLNNDAAGNYTTIIHLNKTFNSHAQLNNYTTYKNNMYLGTNSTEDNITCVNSDVCPSDHFCVLSLEQQTNSHIGDCANYTNKVCCKVTLHKLTQEEGADADEDGVVNLFDKLYWNESNVTTSGISSLNITLDGNGTIYGVNVNVTRYVEFFNNGDKFFNFTWNFTNDILDLSNVTVTKLIDGGSGSQYDGINMSKQLIGKQINNTIIFDELAGVNWLCIKQNDTDSISEISDGCTGPDEFDFSTCITNPTTINDIYCYHDDPGNKFYVTGYNVLGALQHPNPLGPGGPVIPEFDIIGMILAAVVILSMTILRRKIGKNAKKKKRKRSDSS